MEESKMISVGDKVNVIYLGIRGTLNVRKIRFDISAWADYMRGDEGTLEIYHKRSGDEEAYRVKHVTIEANIVTWIVDLTDSSVSGYGEASLVYKRDDTCVRSPVYVTYTQDALAESAVDPPEPGEIYDGPYEVTPVEAEQMLATAGLRLTQDITIHPIPSNYGKITWNGAVLRIS